MAKRRIKKPVVEPVEPFNMTLHVSVTVALFIVALLLLILWGSCYDRKNNITPVDRYSQLPVLRSDAIITTVQPEKREAKLTPLVPVVAVSVPVPQPPQPTTIPPPLDVSLSSYQGDDEPEDNSIERPGCEGGACETGNTGGWYLGKRLGRR